VENENFEIREHLLEYDIDQRAAAGDLSSATASYPNQT
jgi:hypothetical protein